MIYTVLRLKAPPLMDAMIRSSDRKCARRASRQRRRFAFQSLVLLLLTLLVFGDVLFSRDRVVSAPDGDGATLFLGMRAWGFHQLRHGDLPLWNPHLFCGAPFLGGFQSALLYPPNWMYCFLPAERAFNIDVALHVWFSGVFMLAWLNYLRLRPVAALLGAMVFMLGGPHFLHVYPGHLPQLCTIAWTPLVFLAIDGVIRARRSRLPWILLGAIALALQILAGFPQFVLYIGLIAMLYALERLVRRWRSGRPILAPSTALLALVALAAGLSAIQWVTSVDIVSETTRRHLPLEVVEHYALPIENLLTFFAPGFFGDMQSSAYWGRWYLWETMLFIGVIPLLLAIYGARYARNNRRVIAIVLALLSILLAMGSQTPLFAGLYATIPGFAQFRGPAKFSLPALFFLATLSAFGLNAIASTSSAKIHRFAHAVIVFGLLLLGLCGFVWIQGTASISKVMFHVVDWNREHFIDRDTVFAGGFFEHAGRQAVRSVFWGGIALLAAGATLLWRRNRRGCTVVIVSLCAAELLIFSRHYRPSFEPSLAPKREALAAVGADVRVDEPNQTAVFLAGAHSIWGNDATVLQRYRDLAGALGGVGETPEPTQSPFIRDGAALRLLRVGPEPLPRALLIHDWKVIADRATALQTIRDDSFDPTKSVILEAAPSISAKGPASGDELRVKDLSSDELEIQATVKSLAILVITDNYAAGWRTKAQPDSDAQKYDLLPADVAFRGIPLAAGHHHFLLRYDPEGFRIGRAITITSLVIVIALVPFTRRGSSPRARGLR
jgi:hypothetical protein